MLLVNRMDPEGGANWEQLLIHFPNEVDAAQLRDSWQMLTRRHAALRTRFDWPAGGQPVRVEVETGAVDWEVVEAGTDWEPWLKSWLTQDRRRGCVMDRLPLMRHRVVRRGDGGTTVLWSFPHLLLDGRSMSRVLAEWLGEVKDTGEVASVARPHWEWVTRQDWSGAQEYWRRMLEGISPAPRLVLGAGASDRSTAGESKEILSRWDRAFSGRLAAWAAEEGVTLNTVLQLGWGWVAGRYLGLEDVLFTAVRAGRHWDGRGHPDSVGMFMTSLPVRVRMEPGRSIRDVLREIRVQQLELRAHEQAPADQIPGWVKWPAGAPFCEIGMRYERHNFTQALHAQVPGTEGIRIELVERAGMPLFLSVDGEAELELTLEYDPERCVEPLAVRMLGHLRSGLEAMMQDPGVDLHGLAVPLLPGEVRQAPPLDLGMEGAAPDSVLGRLRELARTHPEVVAVEDEELKWSYDRLERYASALARVLRHRGVRVGDRVALSTERRPHGVGGLLGVLRAGAAVLPIDPGLPVERRSFLLEDGGARILVTDAATAGAFEGLDLDRVLIGDELPEVPEEAPTEWADPGPTDPSYIIFTSGTTGKPKGVVNTHRGLANETTAGVRLFQLGVGDRMLHMANLSFDAAYEEIFVTLLAGATLVCRPAGAMDSLEMFHEAVEGRRITVLDLTTSFWAQWVSWMDRRERALPQALRVLVVGGEKTQASTHAMWSRMSAGRVHWVNTYGPTEAAIVATAYVTSAAGVPEGREIPIGRPLPNVHVRVLDSHRREVPAGIQGELYIGGVGVATGYLNRPELTAKSFVEDPWSGEPGARLYKTGDLCRVQEDGELEYLGRADNQVKLRGFRIEVDEVENMLASHPGVAECVVVPMMDAGRVSALVGYVVARGQEPAAGEIREYLSVRLPNYAVPGHIVFLERLPLTGNGKVDRRALPKPEVREESLPGGPPATALERRLERLFAQALRRQAVGAEESFQEAGGDSLMVMELIELASRDGIPLYPETIIRNPTVRKLALFLAPYGVEAGAVAVPVSDSPLSVLREAVGGARLFLCHSTPGDVLGYGNLVHALGEGISVYGFSSLGLQHPERAHGTIEEMSAYYVEHLLKAFPEGPYHLAGWCYGGTVAHEMAAQLARAGHQVGLVGLIDAYAHMPPGPSGLMRWRIRQLKCLLGQGPKRWFSYLATRLGMGTPPYVAPASPGGSNQRMANRNLVRDKNMAAILRYRGERYPGSLTVYLSRQVAPQNLFDPEGAWPLFPGETTIHIIESSHRDILKPPAVDEVAKLIRLSLFGR